MYSSSEVNLTTCDTELIQFPGKIQSYGCLIAIHVETGIIRYVSKNLNQFFDIDPTELLGKHLNTLNEFITHKEDTDLFLFCRNFGSSLGPNRDIFRAEEIAIKKKSFYLTIAPSNDLLVLEFQPLKRDRDIASVFNRAANILAKESLEELYNTAAHEIKALIDYDRVMIYKFLPDGSGEVVGEAVTEGVEPFMGQRYPESDIPKQARALYKLNRMRLTANVAAEDTDLIGVAGSEMLDLTYSVLRAVSPVHILYLKNMGVGASYSLSIVINDELWGLVACQNIKPKNIDLSTRQASMLLTDIISAHILNKTNEQKRVTEGYYQKVISRLQHSLSMCDSITDVLTAGDVSLRQVTFADGVALIYKNKIYLEGETPTIDQVGELAAWVMGKLDDNLFVTNELASHYAASQPYANMASGILTKYLGMSGKELIIWFKKEKVKTILWAGEPKKKLPENDANGAAQILPRTSFKVFRETVRQTSDEWTEEEIRSARSVARVIRDIALKKAEEQILINAKLKEAYDELDSFTYTVSHDLRTPLTVIKTYAQFLLHSQAATDEKSKTLVNNILSGADRITYMLQQLLELSKISQQELELEPVDAREIIDNATNELAYTIDLARVNLSISETPMVKGNKMLLYHVFSNVIENALKYSSKQELPEVGIKGYQKGTKVIYEITDNGVGMDESQHADAFKLFKRLDNSSGFQGSGAGLAIAKKIIERHGGEISFKSKTGHGTTFYLTFTAL